MVLIIGVVSWVSTHGRLNKTRDFGPHGRLPRIKIPYRSCYGGPLKCGTWALTQDQNSIQKLLWWPLEMWYMGAYPGVSACPEHYGSGYENNLSVHLIIFLCTFDFSPISEITTNPQLQR